MPIRPRNPTRLRVASWLLAALVAVATLAAIPLASGAAAATGSSSGTGSFVLAATSTGAGYAPTFTGNGLLGVRVPPSGQGAAAGTVPAEAELAGYYAQAPGGVQQRVAIPDWSGLAFADRGAAFDPAVGHVEHWRQSIDLHTGIVTTTADWTDPSGHRTHLRYDVLTDRARASVALVRLEVTPAWSGSATVTDTIDGATATAVTAVASGRTGATGADWVTVQAVGTGAAAAVASALVPSADAHASDTPVDPAPVRGVGRQIAFAVAAGRTYTFTKYVGVATAPPGGDPADAAVAASHGAETAGFASLVAANDAAWASLWSGRIDVLGDPALATDVDASEFYLWASLRDGVDWSISPAGLSSDGYNGHVFWDAETWMEPALLAQHPDLAVSLNRYRFDRLGAAEQHASASGDAGARFPWESALDGTEQIPPPASLFSEGLYEQHITADVALAQWQYFLATGDTHWLAAQGWPVIAGAATFWASRVTVGPGGTVHVDGVTGPDEEHANVDNEAYTVAAAAQTLTDATRAAHILGTPAPATWGSLARALTVAVDPTTGTHPEFAGYDGSMVKQADVTLLQYPLGVAMSPETAAGDLATYVPRTDPNGPSMSDAVNAIDAGALASSGCSSDVYLLRSVQPYIRDVFHQFSETSTGGTFTFMTGIGGFLQTFLYGTAGLRFGTGALGVAPVLTGQLGGVVLHGIRWHHRTLTVAVGPNRTTVTLDHGSPMTVDTPHGPEHLVTGSPIDLATRRPDRMRTTDLARCGAVSATSSVPGGPPLAAVDGSGATGWQPGSLPATLTVHVAGGPRPIHAVTLQWGRQWPEPPAPNLAPAPGPVVTRRPAGAVVSVSTDGRRWHAVATLAGSGATTTDRLTFPAVQAADVSVRLVAPVTGAAPVLDELTVS